ncbi:hypothetical protein KR100_12555 [Synechococcus sp. KORDI-100]|uniref:DUF1823 family protein n=1 Tax=Synechococcus sp. KORDI-100 TaxID=1280380 RepID=UPI0004E05D9D|nr:DUF1823 family protein [Synechococcus sp. KORDI-100]AII44181.1 hypothetical protein KR100_12555 [Synechococcus sp. KORDI-100]
MLPIHVSDHWPLSRALFLQILDDRCSDQFVCERIWERLGYVPRGDGWHAGPSTPADWADAFPTAPELIAERPASVRLTRSIPKQHKQLLKHQLGFTGYRIGELYPRRTRRATAVSWLLAWLMQQGEPLVETGPLAPELPVPENPVAGHPGDRPVR